MPHLANFSVMPKTVTNDQKLQLCFLAKTFLISFIVNLSSLDTLRNSGCWQDYSNSRFKVGIKKKECAISEVLWMVCTNLKSSYHAALIQVTCEQNHFSLGKYQHVNIWQEGNCYKTSNI